MIEPGQSAPDFELPDQDGRPVRLSEARGRRVVLYFYPKADTPGCTTQACGVRDRAADYEAAGAVVLGVSPDPVAKVKRFHDRFALGFTLLADTDHSVAEAYGVWAQKSRRSVGRTWTKPGRSISAPSRAARGWSCNGPRPALVARSRASAELTAPGE